METTETFEEKYQNLEMEFAERVKEDNRKFEEKVKRGDYSGIYLPNRMPSGPVDYVLVGMEPSRGWAKDSFDACKGIAGGFRNYCGVEILHFPIKKYLLLDGETYYLTDLAKGAMLTKSPDAGSTKKYEAWYPLLEKELKLVAKPGARVIAIGSKVDGFLRKKKLCGRVYADSIPHYSTQAAVQGERKLIENRDEEYKKFAAQLEGKTWAQIIEEKLPESTLRNWTNLEKKPTDWEKKLLFGYKLRFERIRGQDNSR